MKKELREARKGAKDNIIPFEPQLELATDPVDPGDDWLRRLPFGARFVAKGRNYKGPWLDHYGIGMILPECILLAIPHPQGMGMEWRWVDSKVFSRDNIRISVIPEMKEEQDIPAEEEP